MKRAVPVFQRMSILPLDFSLKGLRFFATFLNNKHHRWLLLRNLLENFLRIPPKNKHNGLISKAQSNFFDQIKYTKFSNAL